MYCGGARGMGFSGNHHDGLDDDISGRRSISWECIAAGNDLIMPGYAGDFENIREALQSGKLGREELKDCVRRLITVIYQTLAFEDCRSYGSRVETVRNNRSFRGSL